MILLSERANRTKRGGQQLVGGLDICVNRNHFGRQVESFEYTLDMPFLHSTENPVEAAGKGFRGVFIRAPVVEQLLDSSSAENGEDEGEIRAPSVPGWRRPSAEKVEILASLPATLSSADTHPENKVTSNPSRALGLDKYDRPLTPGIFGDGFGKDMRPDSHRRGEGVVDQEHKMLGKAGDETKSVSVPRGNIVAVRQGNVVGTSFHPELTGDVRMHRWWLGEVVKSVWERRAKEGDLDAEIATEQTMLKTVNRK